MISLQLSKNYWIYILYIYESYVYCFSIFSLFDNVYATYILQYISKLNEMYKLFKCVYSFKAHTVLLFNYVLHIQRFITSSSSINLCRLQFGELLSETITRSDKTSN